MWYWYLHSHFTSPPKPTVLEKKTPKKKHKNLLKQVLKMNGWKTILSFWEGNFSGEKTQTSGVYMFSLLGPIFCLTAICFAAESQR